MPTFILLAAMLTAVMAAFVAVPLLRRRGEAARAPLAAVAVAVVLGGGGAALYMILSNWSWQAPPAADSPQTMVAQLARRLERSPDDLEGWLKLGRSYLVLQQYPLAARAYQRADRLAEGRNVDALTGLAEALALGDENELDGRAGRLLEQALAVDPRSPKALYYGALTALRRGELPVARDRFQKLLALDPPANIKPLLQKQIDAIDAQMRGGPLAGGTSSVALSDATAPNAAASPSQTAEARLQVEIALAPALSPDSDASAPLFVIVREPGVRGPPLAVKRLASRFPQSVELTPADSMMAGNRFQAGQVVEIVARIARSGNPVAASGDPFGVITTRVGEKRPLYLTIDRLTP